MSLIPRPMKSPRYSTDTPKNRKRVERWIGKAMSWFRDYDYSSFDMAVECTDALRLYEYCECNGDNTFIPIWIHDMCESAQEQGRS